MPCIAYREIKFEILVIFGCPPLAHIAFVEVEAVAVTCAWIMVRTEFPALTQRVRMRVL